MFRAPELCDKNLFDKYKKCESNNHSQYNFTNLFMWKHEYQPVFDIVNDMLCIVITYNGEKMALFPLGSGDPGPALDYMFSVFGKLTIAALDDLKIKYLAEYYGINPFCEDIRNNYDYVYSTDRLIRLDGRKLHSKRNHLNRFAAKYDFRFEAVSAENIADCEYVEKKWIQSKYGTFSEYNSSYLSTMCVLKNFDYLGCRGGIIYIDKTPAAFSIGEQMNNDMFVIHIEKASDCYHGIYTAINQLSAERVFNSCKYVNREEDMGIESLRKAKMSYYPEFMLEYKTARF